MTTPHRTPAASMSGLSVHKDSQRDMWRTLPDEVPVALVFDGTTLAVMMASPADIHDLAIGFALSEGIIATAGDVQDFEVAEHPTGLEARLWLRADRSEALQARRRFMAGPVGCGLCGIDSLEQASRPLPHVPDTGLRLTRKAVACAGDGLAARQPLRDQTGATHAAGFMARDGRIVLAREDVGRHNALDKLIGAMARAGLDAGQGAFIMTSRLSVELVQKCAIAGCPVLVSVSAPTAAALRLAEGAGITIAAFARGGGFDIYAHPARIITKVSDAA
ncbi:formate dehydrogenase accessory sulfurtransferase FdhD [Roseinatronobacter sp. S2]|uniref:formate dehydrogenase accessory sulfurtransferase FdhD n=1 Tax=Roseinatronobacter sp. S2 TaxID=3035471 RepID=UPI00240F28B9|nr:formate dehydrogenase accessory sulfurtransferase FdhD [Roseinatronobacter sp. S2]WFE76811.1 formate dehydrogenase accessory sulfurtransferase FdhD [Roseinatronobacter sp. S2]